MKIPTTASIQLEPSNLSLKVEGLSKSYGGKEVLRGVDIEVYSSQLTVITGESGSGKSTLLQCVSGLEYPDTGSAVCDGSDLTTMSPTELTRWRGKNFGFVFQDPRLLGGHNVENNILLPHNLIGNNVDKSWLTTVYDVLGIAKKLKQNPKTLSGGERQRVAIARAVAHQPEILFADEPTSALDSHNKREIHELFKGLVSRGATIVMVSHDSISEEYADRSIVLSDGEIAADTLTTAHVGAVSLSGFAEHAVQFPVPRNAHN